jgi:G3E family GTPase
MHLLIISGFLGAGKTTLIIRLAKEAIAKKLKVAVIVNEVGEIGIDDQFMRQLDLNVWEILGGCICCTLAGDLGNTLDKLIKEYPSDLVLLEPSGVADLRMINEIIAAYEARSIFKTCKLTIVDPLRLPMLMEVLTPLITSQIQSAEWVLINKEDVASSEDMKNACQTVSHLNPEAKIISTSIKQKLDFPILEKLLS